MDDKSKTSLSERHKQHHEYNWSPQNWRAWGSWFSWGSAVGLGLFYSMVMISTGIFLWLVHHR